MFNYYNYRFKKLEHSSDGHCRLWIGIGGLVSFLLIIVLDVGGYKSLNDHAGFILLLGGLFYAMDLFSENYRIIQYIQFYLSILFAILFSIYSIGIIPFVNGDEYWVSAAALILYSSVTAILVQFDYKLNHHPKLKYFYVVFLIILCVTSTAAYVYNSRSSVQISFKNTRLNIDIAHVSEFDPIEFKIKDLMDEELTLYIPFERIKSVDAKFSYDSSCEKRNNCYYRVEMKTLHDEMEVSEKLKCYKSIVFNYNYCTQNIIFHDVHLSFTPRLKSAADIEKEFLIKYFNSIKISD